MLKNKMISSIHKQYLFENASWIRFMDFLIQENTFLKDRLSEVMDQVRDKESLDLAEHFHNQFIIKDDIFEHILNELKIESEKWKMHKKSDNEKVLIDLKKVHSFLKNQMDTVEKEHAILKSDYNTYLSSLPISPELFN